MFAFVVLRCQVCTLSIEIIVCKAIKENNKFKFLVIILDLCTSHLKPPPPGMVGKKFPDTWAKTLSEVPQGYSAVQTKVLQYLINGSSCLHSAEGKIKQHYNETFMF